jgi:flagellar basal-body rod modification protein FlgD
MAVDITNYVNNQQPSGVKVGAGGTANEQSAAAGLENLNTSYSTFLKLLTAQLKNQDPTSPLDPNQFTAQIVQMTGVQQQLLTNNLLGQMLTSTQTNNGYGAVGLIGKTVQATGSATELKDGQAAWSYELPELASSAKISISNDAGRVVWTGDAADLTAGTHDFTWDGKDSNGQAMPDGTYTISVAALDANAKAMTPTTYIRGVVSALEQADGVSQVLIGKTRAPLSGVVKVSS